MKSITQIKPGESYYWQTRKGSDPILVKVIERVEKSKTLVNVKNVNPDDDFIVSVRKADGTLKFYNDTRPKGSNYKKNLQKGDKYENVHIRNLTAEKPEKVLGSKEKTNFAK